MKKETRISSSLVWYHKDDIKTPAIGNRIVVFSPSYDIDDPYRIRCIDSQFYPRATDIEWWAYINLPE